jgi:hypothetical protein
LESGDERNPTSFLYRFCLFFCELDAGELDGQAPFQYFPVASLPTVESLLYRLEITTTGIKIDCFILPMQDDG